MYGFSDMIDQESRTWAMWSHLASFAGFFLPMIGHIGGPLIVWLAKGKNDPFVDQHGKEALNFQISIVIYSTILFILGGIGLFATAGTALLSIGAGTAGMAPAVMGLIFLIVFFLLLLVFVLWAQICVIRAALKAKNGEYVRYPLTLRFFK